MGWICEGGNTFIVMIASGMMIRASRRDGGDVIARRVVKTALAVVTFRRQAETSTIILAGRRVVHRHRGDGPFCCCAYILVVAMSMRTGDGSPKANAIGDGRATRLVGRQWRIVVSNVNAAEEGCIAYEAPIFGVYFYACLIVIGIAVVVGVG